ncbi:hypothetical protein IAQ61_006462 [Plenodomus lingam]|uniref:uncharacterized protein n=1 Tax=Leptosphaeria maculans TaxID=5022 RepID=UPI003331FD95|nr:hypothetical protein IAQ61_006462 [Plenodomus lingam]
MDRLCCPEKREERLIVFGLAHEVCLLVPHDDDDGDDDEGHASDEDGADVCVGDGGDADEGAHVDYAADVRSGDPC